MLQEVINQLDPARKQNPAISYLSNLFNFSLDRPLPPAKSNVENNIFFFSQEDNLIESKPTKTRIRVYSQITPHVNNNGEKNIKYTAILIDINNFLGYTCS